MRFWLGYAKAQFELVRHKFFVAYYMLRFAISTPEVRRWAWARRALVHDLSKFSWAEASCFAKTIFELKTTTYGTPEYIALLNVIRPAIDHHYALNSHHPEYHDTPMRGEKRDGKRGYAQMPSWDKFEMVCDWAAAVRRHDDGDLADSIIKNAERFGYDRDELLALAGLAVRAGAM